MSRKFISVLLVVLSAHARAQTPRAFEQAALLSYEAKDYYAAYKYFDRVLEMEPSRADIAVRCAESATLYGAQAEAERYYESALRLNNLSSGKLGLALMGLAKVKKNLGKYEESIQLFEKYLSRPDIDPAQEAVAVTEIANCEWALEKLTNPDQLVQVVPFDNSINTSESEMGMLKLDGKCYFGGLYPVNWGDKYRPARPLLQVLVSEEGMQPQLAAFNQAKKHTALPAFSPDGQFMVLPVGEYVAGMEVRCELYFLTKQGTQWSVMTRLPDLINQNGFSQTHPCIAQRMDGYFDLYYISDVPGGMGGKDIWCAKFSAQGVFDRPENLKAINTAGEEATPFFDPTTGCMYFSSTGYPSLGGYDVYRAFKKGTDWLPANHLPSPVNSSHNDLFYRPLSFNSGLLTSNRIGAVAQGDAACCYDLFQVNIHDQQLVPVAVDGINGQQIQEVHYRLMSTESTQPISELEKGYFELRRDQEYLIVASSPGYFQDTFSISTFNQEAYPPIVNKKITLRPLPVEIHLQVFDQLTQELLKGVQVSVLNASSTPFQLEYIGDSLVSALRIKAEPYSSYTLIAEKEGYTPDTLEVGAVQLSAPGTQLQKSLFLEPVNLQRFLPLALYFDNDHPKPAAPNQVKSYERTYDAYYQLKGQYAAAFAAGLSSLEEQDCAVERLELFFEKEVKAGYLQLEDFAAHLDLFLKNDYAVEILIKGFASPLASKEYNLALTKRRVQSVKNYLRTVNEGIYNKYIVQRQLVITLAPMGESSVAQPVSDNYRKKHESVYSVEASRERRAEIIEVRLSKIYPSPDNQTNE